MITVIYNGGALNNNQHPSNLDAPIFDTTRFNTNSSLNRPEFDPPKATIDNPTSSGFGKITT